MSAPDEEQHVEVGRHRIRVRTTGDGPPLLLMMGVGGNVEMWDALLANLPDRQLIAFDMPGTGGSSTSFVPMPMILLARIVDRLLDRLGYAQVDVLGLSWGGLLAQQFAITHRPRVRRLVLAATLPGGGGVPGRPSAIRVLLTPRRYYSRDYLERVAPTLYGGRIRNNPELFHQQAVARFEQPPSMVGYVNQLFAAMTFTSLPFLRCIHAPTLILAGNDDPIVPLINGRILQRGIRDSRLEIIAGGGHLFLFEEAARSGELITRFLDDAG